MSPLTPRDATHPISDEEFTKFCEFFLRKTGINFSENKKYYVERRIVDRIRITGSTDFQDYFRLIRFQKDGTEMQLLVNAMTINETYFFREDYQFEAMVRTILPEIARTRTQGATIRIWSLPCSTGEEPYSIAIYILDRWNQADDFDIQILASDIDSRVLAEARLGIYGPRSIHRLSNVERARYLADLGDNRFQIRDQIRESIDFSLINITCPAQMGHVRDIDLIFCRNLLIYFDDVTRREAVETLYQCLMPGGVIFLGHSESMSRMSSLFRPRKVADTIIYQKPFLDE